MFENASEYDAQLSQGLKVSGEDKEFFIAGRIRYLAACIADLKIQVYNVLDYGCGTGTTAPYLTDTFGAAVHGVDTSTESIDLARQTCRQDAISFCSLSEFKPNGRFDLCYVNGVFHHIEPPHRPAAMKCIFESLNTDGVLAFFENNPWNPGTRWVMSKIPFDRDAITLSYLQGVRLLKESGFELALPPQFLFYFPKSLSFLRPLEPLLKRVPFGAQYLLLARKRR